MKNSYDIVIIGGGIVGCSAAYYASKAGQKVLLIEKDSIASHASGFAYGGITPHVGLDEDDPYNQISKYSYELHKILADEIPNISGIDYGYRTYPNFELSLNEKDEKKLKSIYEKNLDSKIYEWCSKEDLKYADNRLGPSVTSALVTKLSSGVEPYKLTFALGVAAEKNGVKILNSEVKDIKFENDESVIISTLNNKEIISEKVLVAAGPWSSNFSKWFGFEIPIKPLKGQILRLKSDQVIENGFHWGPNYVTTKQDGLIWAGTTEEDVGFDENPSNFGLTSIMESLIQVFPFLEDSELVLQTACLRPLAVDKSPILTKSERGNAYLASGTGRQGILLGPAMGKLILDTMLFEKTAISIDPFSHKRFSNI
jgi:glycine oxidase